CLCFGCSGGKTNGKLFQAQKRITRISRQNLALVDKVEDRKTARNLHWSHNLANIHLLGSLSQRLRQLGRAYPAKIAAGHRCRSFGKLTGIGHKGAALTDLVEYLAHVRCDLFSRFGGSCHVNLANTKLGSALGCFQPLDDRVYFFLTDIDERLDIAPKQAVPGQFALDLTLQSSSR